MFENDDPRDGEDFTDTFSQESIDSADEKPYRRHPAVKFIAGILLLAFLSFALPQIQLLLNNKYDFLKDSNVPSANEVYSHVSEAVVAVDAIVNPLLSSKVKQGTGFNISQEGLIITNEHVIRNANGVKVQFADGHEYYSDEFWSIEGSDIAFIKLKENQLPAVSLEIDRLPDLGDDYTVIGNPLGLDRIVLTGTLENYFQISEFDHPVMCLNIACQPGNSGSPVINHEGKVAAVVFAVRTSPSVTNPTTQTLAVPLYYLRDQIL